MKMEKSNKMIGRALQWCVSYTCKLLGPHERKKKLRKKEEIKMEERKKNLKKQSNNEQSRSNLWNGTTKKSDEYTHNTCEAILHCLNFQECNMYFVSLQIIGCQRKKEKNNHIQYSNHLLEIKGTS